MYSAKKAGQVLKDSNITSSENKDIEQASVLKFLKPLSRQQNSIYREKVLTRKRKRSKHPLRDLRLKSGYTLEELAEITEMSPSYLSRLESGTRRLNADILQRLSFALSCNPAELLSFSNSNVMGVPGPKNMIQSHMEPDDTKMLQYQLTAESFSSGSLLFQKDNTKLFSKTLTVSKKAFACEMMMQTEGNIYPQGSQLIVDPLKPLQENCKVLVITNDNKAFLGRFMNWNRSSVLENPTEVTIQLLGNNTEEKNFTLKQNNLKSVYRVIGHIEAT